MDGQGGEPPPWWRNALHQRGRPPTRQDLRWIVAIWIALAPAAANVELAICAQDGERNSFTCADLRALAVTVAAQALPETARHVHNGPRDRALCALRMVHARHALLRRGGPRARQAQPSGSHGSRRRPTPPRAPIQPSAPPPQRPLLRLAEPFPFP